MSNITLKMHQLPTEIHHLIFEYLDYVADICRHAHLARIHPAPIDQLNLHLSDATTILPLDPMPPPLCLTCSSLHHSIQTFRPLDIRIRMRKIAHLAPKGSYLLESYVNMVDYMALVGKKKVLYDDRVAVDGFENWCDVLDEFVARRRQQCGKRVFDRVEHVGFYSHMARSVCRNVSVFGTGFYAKTVDILKSFMHVKYVTYDLVHAEQRLEFEFLPSVKVNLIQANSIRYYFSSLKAEFYEVCLQSKHIPELVFEKIPKRYHHFEAHLFIAILYSKYEMANRIIDNCHLDIDYFYYLWCCMSNTTKSLIDSLPIFIKLKEKYPRLDVKKFPIDCLSDYDKLCENGFDVDFEENITKKFVASCRDQHEHYLKQVASKINFNSIGRYHFSILHFMPEINPTLFSNFSLNVHAKDTYYGIPASFILLFNTRTIEPFLLDHVLDVRD